MKDKTICFITNRYKDGGTVRVLRDKLFFAIGWLQNVSSCLRGIKWGNWKLGEIFGYLVPDLNKTHLRNLKLQLTVDITEYRSSVAQ